MADATATKAASSPQKKGKSADDASKKPPAKSTHPKTSDMVNNAIKSLEERSGSSLQAIKKYISLNYIVDLEKISTYIKKYIKNAVIEGKLIQTKGKGASGSFKLPPKKNKSEEKKSTAPKKEKSTSDEKKTKVKKVGSPSKKKPAAKSDKEKAAAPVKDKKSSSKMEKPTKPKISVPKTKVPNAKKAAPAKKLPKKPSAPKSK